MFSFQAIVEMYEKESILGQRRRGVGRPTYVRIKLG
jgi:hypothetical protein